MKENIKSCGMNCLISNYPLDIEKVIIYCQ